jgi:hypothetical protein
MAILPDAAVATMLFHGVNWLDSIIPQRRSRFRELIKPYPA